MNPTEDNQMVRNLSDCSVFITKFLFSLNVCDNDYIDF